MSLKQKVLLYASLSLLLTLSLLALGTLTYLLLENKSRASRFYDRIVSAFVNTQSLIKEEEPLTRFLKTVDFINAVLETRSVLFLDKRFVPEELLEGKLVVSGYIVDPKGVSDTKLITALLEIELYGTLGPIYKPMAVARYPLGDDEKPYGFVYFIKPIKHDLTLIAFLLAYPLIAVGVASFPVYRLVGRLVREVNFIKTLSQDFSKNQFSRLELLRKNLRETKEKNDEVYELKLSILKMMEALEKLLLKTTKEKIHYETMALTDPLTNLYNRRVFLEVAEKELSRAKRVGSPFSILLLDIDDFKRINDTYGHDVGDVVLKRVSETLRRNVRKMDLVARWGGEEFIVMLPHTNLQNAYKVAEKLRRLVENLRVKLPGGEEINVSVSVGVSAFKGHKRLEDIIKEADLALYEAKRKGKNRVEVFRESLTLERPEGS
ncbi:MAG: GGDEF domain-containing protein [Aquificae bacterium]|nr:GGDEF domain-containing protein [Aquificota bacterium]